MSHRRQYFSSNSLNMLEQLRCILHRNMGQIEFFLIPFKISCPFDSVKQQRKGRNTPRQDARSHWEQSIHAKRPLTRDLLSGICKDVLNGTAHLHWPFLFDKNTQMKRSCCRVDLQVTYISGKKLVDSMMQVCLCQLLLNLEAQSQNLNNEPMSQLLLLRKTQCVFAVRSFLQIVVVPQIAAALVCYPGGQGCSHSQFLDRLFMNQKHFTSRSEWLKLRSESNFRSVLPYKLRHMRSIGVDYSSESRSRSLTLQPCWPVLTSPKGPAVWRMIVTKYSAQDEGPLLQKYFLPEPNEEVSFRRQDFGRFWVNSWMR